MKKGILFFAIVFICNSNIHAQQFIDKATIEFEVKTNVKKTMGNGMWADLLKDMPQYKTGYFNFSFSGGKSIYKFDHWADGPKVPEFLRKDDELSTYFFDHNVQKMHQQKLIRGSEFYVQDSIPKIKWRLSNESREIAGFNCRKAVGVIMDSVYIFAFYTEEILIPGGPCSISGLPGMIMGLTIPRLYTSFIATKVKLSGVDETEIKPAAAKKPSTRADLRNFILERMKEWYSDNDDEDSKNWRNNFVWSVLL